MILHEYKTIFVHIERTGGSSVEMALCGEDLWETRRQEKHMSAKTIINTFGTQLWKEYFTFTFVGNPWDWVVSNFLWKRQEKRPVESRLPSNWTLKDFLLKGNNIKNPLRPNTCPPYVYSQYDFLSYKGKIAVDFVGRYETLERDFKYICGEIGVEPKILPNIKKGDHSHYHDYYTPTTRDLVARMFKKDIEFFGYEF